MATIDGKSVLFSETAVLRAGAENVCFVTPVGEIAVEFSGADSPAIEVQPMIVGGRITFRVSDSDKQLPYVYDGHLNADGVRAYELSFYVSPVGVEPRARLVSLTLVKMQP